MRFPATRLVIAPAILAAAACALPACPVRQSTFLPDAGPPADGQPDARSTGARPEAEPGPEAAAYEAHVIDKALQGIMRAHPEDSLEARGRRLGGAEAALVRDADGRTLDAGAYHVLRLPNPGPVAVRWTGFADGNGQVLVSSWEGEAWLVRDFLGIHATTSCGLVIDRPALEEIVYIMVHCTRGQIHTDAFEAWRGKSAPPGAKPTNVYTPGSPKSR